MSESGTQGFTLLELCISSALLVPILLAIVSTRDVVGRSITTLNGRSDTGDHVRRVSRKLRQIVRPALASSVETRATQHDLDSAQAAEAQRVIDDPVGTAIQIPTLGEWISPAQFEPRKSLRFVAAGGGLASASTPRVLEFELDSEETINGKDDDSDGIVDEGTLYLRQDGISYLLLNNVESWSVRFDNRVLVVSLRAARRDSSGGIHRATIRQRILLRNK